MIMKLIAKDIEFSILVLEMEQKYKVELGTLFSELKNMQRENEELCLPLKHSCNKIKVMEGQQVLSRELMYT